MLAARLPPRHEAAPSPHLRRPRHASCPGVLTISTQSGNDFSGSFAVQSAPGCDAQQGTIAGTVRDDGTISFTADAPGGGPNVWEDAAERNHCRLVSGSSFDGNASGG